MPAHHTRTLFETARGRVRRCACCPRLELRFGNALLSLAPDDLAGVLDQLRAAEAPAEPETPAEAWRGAPAPAAGREVRLTLGDTGCGWVFSADEAAELHRLVAGAGLMLELAAA